MSKSNENIKLIFHGSPRFLKELIISYHGFKESLYRYGERYEHYLDFIEHSQWWDNQKLKAYQLDQVKAFLLNSFNKSPYYSTLFNKLGFDPTHLNDLKDVSKLPILTKNEARNSLKNILPLNLKEYRARWTHTSGTTGQALVFPVSQDSQRREYAFRNLHYSWAGIKDGMPIAVCAGHPIAYKDRKKPPFWARDRYNNRLLLSSFHMTQDNLIHYINVILKFNPVMIKGYPSSVYLLALANRKFGQKVKVKAVFTASETLFDFQRKTIEESFGCRVFNWYGTAEYSGNIVECESAQLHVKLEHSYVEFLDQKNNPVQPGMEGRLVCTAFANNAFPLIRYDIGDVAVPSENQKCTCGRGGTLVDYIHGRAEDYILTPEGKFVGRLDHLFKDAVNVISAQLVQHDTSEIIVRIVRNNIYSKKDEDEILKEARNRLGTGIKISFDYVNEISRTAGGKFPFIVSTIEKKQLWNEFIDIVE